MARPVQLDVGSGIDKMTFTPDGKYFVGGNHNSIRMWRVQDGQEMARMEVELCRCVAVSNDGGLIAAGTATEGVVIWDTETHERIFALKEDDHAVFVVDFAPNAPRLVSAPENSRAIVWDLETRRIVQLLGQKVNAAKYSPDGDRLATTTQKSVRVWDSSFGFMLVDIPFNVAPHWNICLHWLNDHLLVESDDKIKEIDASTGSVLEWPAPYPKSVPHIQVPKHGQFIVYSTSDVFSLWDTSTHIQLGSIQRTPDMQSITFSPDDQLLAIYGIDGKITMKNLKDVLLPSRSAPPFIYTDVTALYFWRQDELENAEFSLSETIAKSWIRSHHALANRALVRAHLGHCNLAIDDAEISISSCPSVIGYIAKSVALIGGGRTADGRRAYDFVFRHCRPHEVDLLLLIKAVVLFMAGEHDDAMSRVDDLIATTHLNSIYHVVQAYMYLLLGKLRMENRDYVGAIESFERARPNVRCHLLHRLCTVSLISGWKFDDIDVMIQQQLCEALYAADRNKDAADHLLKLVKTFEEEVASGGSVTKWVSDFTHQCLSVPKNDVHETSNATRHPSPQAPGATFDSQISVLLLKEWAKATLTRNSWKEALAVAGNFVVPRFTVYQVIYDHLEAIGQMMDAGRCFQQMVDEMVEQGITDGGQVSWVLSRLEGLGDLAMSLEWHEEAISHYSTALSLGPTSQDLFVKRSKAYLAKGSWEHALNDANKVIELDPLSPWGYERKHAALHQAEDYENAVHAFEEMLSKVSQSSVPEIRERHRQYVEPTETRVAIRTAVQDAIRESPRVLIDTLSGRLLNQSEQATSFESLRVFKKLVSSMTRSIDHSQIERDVAEHFRYAMFSHKWENSEPLFEEVVRTAVHDLEDSPTRNKLKMFCKVVRDAGLNWAWSDTCCINKADHFVLQEALVAMFKWYKGSALTIVLLQGIPSPSRRGDLVRSIWNTRAWTFQEYHASKVVRFYNEDWTLYMNLDIPNHKESPEIISEMEEVTGISSQALISLRPGLDDIREKLCLASTRQTTLVEDAAYSLLGIFSVTMPVVYGEGDQALGRLLAQLLTSSGDTSILAWTGKSGSFNSCLPFKILVFNQLPTSHIPRAITSSEMETVVSNLRASFINFACTTKLYDRVNELRVPAFAGKRMTLPCIVFKLGALSVSRGKSGRVFRAQTDVLGIVEITTEEDISRLHSLYLVHPWIDFLLDRQPVGNVIDNIPEENTDDQSSATYPSSSSSRPSTTSTTAKTRTARLASRFGLNFGGRNGSRSRDVASLRPPSTLAQTDKQMRALQLVARLRQPFGALLLTPTRQNMQEYRRVAAESLITVQVEEITTTILNKLIDSVRVLDVL